MTSQVLSAGCNCIIYLYGAWCHFLSFRTRAREHAPNFLNVTAVCFLPFRKRLVAPFNQRRAGKGAAQLKTTCLRAAMRSRLSPSFVSLNIYSAARGIKPASAPQNKCPAATPSLLSSWLRSALFWRAELIEVRVLERSFRSPVVIVTSALERSVTNVLRAHLWPRSSRGQNTVVALKGIWVCGQRLEAAVWLLGLGQTAPGPREAAQERAPPPRKVHTALAVRTRPISIRFIVLLTFKGRPRDGRFNSLSSSVVDAD